MPFETYAKFRYSNEFSAQGKIFLREEDPLIFCNFLKFLCLKFRHVIEVLFFCAMTRQTNTIPHLACVRVSPNTEKRKYFEKRRQKIPGRKASVLKRVAK